MSTLTYFSLGNFFFKNKSSNIHQIIFVGFIFISLISLILNFFLPLSKNINTLVIFIILLISIFRFKISIDEIKNILFISVFTFFLIIYDTVYRPDAYFYHLPYSQILNENKIILGLSNLHFRFGHVSILQYISSINLTYFSGINGLLTPVAIFWSNLLLYFAKDSLRALRNSDYSISKVFSLIIFLFICTRINRYGEFGNDAVGHLALFYVVSLFLNYEAKNIDKFKELLLCSVFVFINKTFLAFIFIIPIYIFLYEKHKFFKTLFSLPTFLLLLWIFKNLLISGCIIYPLEKTCINKFKWTNIEDTRIKKIESEAWSKGWPDRVQKNITPKEFTKGFSWVQTWVKKNLNIFLKNFLILVLIILLVFIFTGHHEINKKNKKKILILLIFSTLGSIYYFLKFPIYRYGYSYFVTFLIFFGLFFLKPQIKNFKNNTMVKYLFILGFIILSGKQIQRINNNIALSPIPNLNYSNNFEINKISNSFNYYYSKIECGYKKAPCTNYKHKNLKHQSLYGYDILYLESK